MSVWQHSERSEQVRERIAAACSRSGRHVNDVQVIAVTKYVDLSHTSRLLEQGFVHLGESRWQDARPKWEAIGNAASWHFIGHLQTNKVREVVQAFHTIHSLDRLSLAEELQRRAEGMDKILTCFVQVNVSGEMSKYGLQPEQVAPFLKEIRGKNYLRIAGLMTMAPFEAEPEQTRPVFSGLRRLRDELNDAQLLEYPLVELSMGMSNDFEVAIEEGATWIRLGTILTGGRH